MSTALERSKPTAGPHGDEGRLLLGGVSWDQFETLLELFSDRPLRLTYDRGTLELTSPSPLHERYKSIFTRMIETLGDELEVDYFALGSTTFASRALERGLEPDACFLIANAGCVTDWRNYDPAVDPPPDLAVEIDVTSDSRKRMEIYAALNIPEVWRFDGNALVVWTPRAGRFAASPSSPAFPTVPIQRLARFVLDYRSGTDREWIRQFRRWLRESVVPGEEG
jgi:Uma2 family endonuclease